MNTTDEAKSDYLLLFRGPEWDEGLSPAQLQEAIGKTMAWFDGLFKTGRVKSGQPLGREGKTISGKNATVSDGPFMESKEMVGGYLWVQVANEQEAVAIARSYPMLERGVIVEVRPILQECPVFQRAQKILNFGSLAGSMS
jgi:hypothetical protein